MRTQKSAKNLIFALIANVFSIFIGIVTQSIFLKNLGTEYLGLNNLFVNIVSMLCIVELGIGNAIVFHLYKPIYETNIDRIKSLMKFYKKAYHLISIIVFVFGLALIPFLHLFIKNYSIQVNIYIVFILFIIDASFSYLLSYKRSILYADQKNYIINLAHLIYLLLMNFIQIAILIITKNYILFLIIKIIFRLLENITISLIVNKMYPSILEKDVKKLPKEILDDIKIKVKSLFIHQIGAFCVNGTDNLIISSFLGLKTVGLYSNYYLIINSVNTIFSQSFSTITASVGNLLVSKDKSNKMIVYNRLNFMNFWFSTFTMICIFILAQDFISLFFGSEYLLSLAIVWVLCNNYFLQTMKRTITVFKEAAGIFYEDRFVPIIESVVNLITSIIMVQFFGLIGVFIGTILSSFVLHFYSYPKFVYKKILEGKQQDYILKIIKQSILVNIILMIVYIATLPLSSLSIVYRFIFKIIISIIVPNVIMLILFNKKDEFKYFFNLLKSKLNRKVNL